MSEVEITVKGLQESLQSFGAAVEVHLPAAVETLQKLGEEARGNAADEAPVKTGFLRASIQMVPTDDGCFVTAGAGYSGFQEYGTKKIAPKFFMRHAILDEVIAKLFDEYDEMMSR
jgi:hypothetical protein